MVLDRAYPEEDKCQHCMTKEVLDRNPQVTRRREQVSHLEKWQKVEWDEEIGPG